MKFSNFAVGLNTKCNFRCSYCFFEDENKSGEEISYITLNEFRKFVLRYGKKKVTVDVFGTEPLISWDKLTHLVRMAETYRWIVGVTTNGSLITKSRAEFFADKRVGLLVSYDGSRKSHNRFRKFGNGQGTWQKVVSGIKYLHDAGVSYGCAMTLAPENVPYLVHNVKSAAARGFKYIALNAQFQVGKSAHPTSYDWDVLRRKYREAAEWALRHEIPLKFTMDAMRTYASTDKSSSVSATCGACKGSIAVDWDGQCYICHRALGDPYFKVGDLTGLVEEAVNSYRQRDINECHSCVLFHQRGPCGHCWTMSKALFGDIKKVPEELCMFQSIMHDIDMDLHQDYGIATAK